MKKAIERKRRKIKEKNAGVSFALIDYFSLLAIITLFIVFFFIFKLQHDKVVVDISSEKNNLDTAKILHNFLLSNSNNNKETNAECIIRFFSTAENANKEKITCLNTKPLEKAEWGILEDPELVISTESKAIKVSIKKSKEYEKIKNNLPVVEYIPYISSKGPETIKVAINNVFLG